MATNRDESIGKFSDEVFKLLDRSYHYSKDLSDDAVNAFGALFAVFSKRGIMPNAQLMADLIAIAIKVPRKVRNVNGK